MKKLIALEPEVYKQLTEKELQPITHTSPEKKILSNLDTQMQEILHSDLPQSEKLKLYNQILQKSKIFLQKSQPKPKQVVFKKEKKQLPETEILKKFRKQTKVKNLLETVKREKNLNWDSEGQLVIDGRPIPGSNIQQLLQSVLKKRNPTTPGLREFESFLWQSL